jgi:hypothetical protein
MVHNQRAFKASLAEIVVCLIYSPPATGYISRLFRRNYVGISLSQAACLWPIILQNVIYSYFGALSDNKLQFVMLCYVSNEV